MSGLPRGWIEARLYDFCAFENGDRGKNYSGRSTFVASGVPFISAGHLNNGHIDWQEMNYIPQANYDRLGSGKVKTGDFLFCLRGSLGKHAFVPKIDAAAIASSLVIVRPSHLSDSKFVDYYFRSSLVKSSIEVYSNGVAQPNLSSTNLGRFEFPLPPLAEQKRIVAKLDALNAKSARARTELARIETLVSRYKQAVLSKAFSGEFTREWRHLAGGLAPIKPRQASQMKPAYRSSPEEAFDAPYDLPASWEWLTLPSVGDLDRGKSKHRPRNDSRLFDGPFPFIQTGDVRAADQYVRNHSQTYSEFGLAQSKLWPAETLCITIAANIAETALLSYPACFPDSVVGFAGDEDKMLPKYAEFFLRTAKERISQFAPATAQKNINLEILAAVRIPVAPLEEQHEIVRRIESAFARIDRLGHEAKRALELVGRLDEAILAKAFRGELVPQEENDEPAEHLLARIRAERDKAPKAKRGQKVVGQ